ncbi:hypothetical protein HSX11_06800 [Oxalobacteraceae bacterium]|nr:hypothetical protein [Oxalobacteraceae bacterium]
MLQLFYAWARATIATLPEDMASQLVLGQASLNSTVRLDLETGNATGRVTCWENGNFSAEIVDAGSKRQRYALQGKFDPSQAIGPQLEIFLARLGVAGPPLEE